MGGGTGTGAAPVVAELARELGALTIAIVTRPFVFEGARRQRLASDGVTALMGRVDTLITIPNERLIEVVERRSTVTEAFRMADDGFAKACKASPTSSALRAPSTWTSPTSAA